MKNFFNRLYKAYLRFKGGDPLARVNDALVQRVYEPAPGNIKIPLHGSHFSYGWIYRDKLDGGALCSEGDAWRLPLFRGCALGTPAEAAQLFAWVEGGSWTQKQRPSWMRYYYDHYEEDLLEVGEAPAPLTGLFQAFRSRLSLSGNLVGIAQAEVLFIREGSEPSLILEQLGFALRVSRPWAIVFVLEEEGGGREWQREVLLGIRSLIDDEIAQIKFWKLTWETEVASVLDKKLWDLALEKGEAAGRKELLFIDAMVPVLPGTFCMGSEDGPAWDPAPAAERPRHEVTISRGFWISQTPVTQELYRLVMWKNYYQGAFKGATRPVEKVNWFQAVRFCNQLSELAGLEPVYEIGEGLTPPVSRKEGADGFQLPTEAEWEYAAKAGTELIHAGSDELDEVAWHRGNADGQTRPVGQKRPNAFGLYDMSGNVWEWCFDKWNGGLAYREREGGVTDPVCAVDEGTYRVPRGGSWSYSADYCRVANRRPFWAGSSDIGFRVIRRM